MREEGERVFGVICIPHFSSCRWCTKGGKASESLLRLHTRGTTSDYASAWLNVTRFNIKILWQTSTGGAAEVTRLIGPRPREYETTDILCSFALLPTSFYPHLFFTSLHLFVSTQYQLTNFNVFSHFLLQFCSYSSCLCTGIWFEEDKKKSLNRKLMTFKYSAIFSKKSTEVPAGRSKTICRANERTATFNPFIQKTKKKSSRAF